MGVWNVWNDWVGSGQNTCQWYEVTLLRWVSYFLGMNIWGVFGIDVAGPQSQCYHAITWVGWSA